MKGGRFLCVHEHPVLQGCRLFGLHGYRVAGHTDDPLHFNPVIRSIDRSRRRAPCCSDMMVIRLRDGVDGR